MIARPHNTLYGRYAQQALLVLTMLGLSLASPFARADSAQVYLSGLPCATPLVSANTPPVAHLAGTAYTHAIVGPQSPGSPPEKTGGAWQIDFDLGSKYSQLTAQAGVADWLPKGSAIFTVTGDGKSLFASDAMRSGDEPCQISIDVTGVKDLSLTVTAAPGGTFPKYVVWADPQLTLAAPEAPAPSPTSTVPQAVQASADSNPPAAAAPALDPNTIAVIPLGGQFQNSPLASDRVTQAIDDAVGAKTSMTVLTFGRTKQMMNDTTGYLDQSDLDQAAQLLGARYIVMGYINTYEIHRRRVGSLLGIPDVASRADVQFDGELWDAVTNQKIKSLKCQASKDKSTIATGEIDNVKFLLPVIQQAAQQFAQGLAPSLKQETNTLIEEPGKVASPMKQVTDVDSK